MFIVKLADHDGNPRCLVEKNVPRWQDSAESLVMETKSCLWRKCPLCFLSFCCKIIACFAYVAPMELPLKELSHLHCDQMARLSFQFWPF